MKTNLQEIYAAQVRAGEVKADAGQGEALTALAGLAQKLPQMIKPALWPIQRRSKNRGLYIYGPVGRGKTMLMDLFFDNLTGFSKRRVHFHAFMLDVHRRLHAAREDGEDKIMRVVAADLAKEAQILCFDEFQVYNIADAMILSRLFRALFRAGVAVVATSNVAPDDLYKEGLQRALFLPFIELIKRRLTIIPVGAGADHRQARLKGKPVYFTPLGAAADAGLENIFNELTDGAIPEVFSFKVDGRLLEARRCAKGVARFSFDDLCRRPVGTADYLAFTQHFHTLLIDNVPVMRDDRRDEALRFIHLIDCLYDTGTKLAISAAAEPEKLFEGSGDIAQRFQRTASRLQEMRAESYVLAPHKTHKNA